MQIFRRMGLADGIRAELAAMLQRYKEVAGYDLARLKAMAGGEARLTPVPDPGTASCLSETRGKRLCMGLNRDFAAREVNSSMRRRGAGGR
jgi:hypothetical protein